jgi:hypothetical protein
MVRITTVGKPYFSPHLQRPNFDPFRLLKPHDAEIQNCPNSTSVPAIPEESAPHYQEALTYLAGVRAVEPPVEEKQIRINLKQTLKGVLSHPGTGGRSFYLPWEE